MGSQGVYFKASALLELQLRLVPAVFTLEENRGRLVGESKSGDHENGPTFGYARLVVVLHDAPTT